MFRGGHSCLQRQTGVVIGRIGRVIHSEARRILASMPVDSLASFDSLPLHPLVRRGVDALGFVKPTPIQEALAPVAMAGRDAIGLAPTGTGKTLAYVMPLAHLLLSDPPPMLRATKTRKATGTGSKKSAPRVDPRARLRAVILCPTRELAQQVAKDAAALVKGSLLRVGAVWGKSPLGPQREMIERGVDIVAGTPGRIRELLDLDAISLAYVRHVVVDEADRMLDLGFLPQVERILERMPPERQIILLSATFPPAVNELSARFLRDPARIESGGHSRPAEHIGQTVYEIEDAFKTALVLALVSGQKKRGVLVFARTRRRAGWVAAALRNNGILTGLVHGDRSQLQREHALEEFGAGRLAVLVATDVAARGLHIPAIRTVVNYDVPLMPEEYVHRVGRAGHGGGFAESFTFVSADAEEQARWKRQCKIASLDITPTPPPDVTPWMRPADRERFQRTVVGHARAARQAMDEEQHRAMRDAALKEEQLARLGRDPTKPLKKTTKRAGKGPKPLRGGASKKRVDRTQEPGSGVRRTGAGAGGPSVSRPQVRAGRPPQKKISTKRVTRPRRSSP